MLGHRLDVATSFLATLARGAAGASVRPLGPRPAQLLELYDFEGCPFCRKAREALSVLDLDARVYPCPKGGPRFRPELIARGGKAQFPYLVDPNTGVEMYESDDIVRYLFERYGAGRPPLALAPAIADVSSALSSLARPGAGVRYRAARAPEAPLELWSFEASPYCRLVREELSALELPYVLHNLARGSAKREAFARRAGRVQVPYLSDPNTGKALFESADIVRYLRDTYALEGRAAAA